MTTFDDIRKRGPFSHVTILASKKNGTALVMLHHGVGGQRVCGFNLSDTIRLASLDEMREEVLTVCNEQSLLVRSFVEVQTIDTDTQEKNSETEQRR